MNKAERQLRQEAVRKIDEQSSIIGTVVITEEDFVNKGDPFISQGLSLIMSGAASSYLKRSNREKTV